MSETFNIDIQMEDNEILNLSDPTTAKSALNRDFGLNRSNHTGSQTSDTISNFESQVKLDETTTEISIDGRVIDYTDEDGVGTNIIIPFPDHQSVSQVSNNSGTVGINNTTTLVTWLSLTINVPVAGNYDLDWFYNWSHNNLSRDFIGYVLLDGNIIAEHTQEPKDVGGSGINLSQVGGGNQNSGTSQRYAFSGFLPDEPLSAGAHTMLIEWSSSEENDKATIYRGSLRAKRIS